MIYIHTKPCEETLWNCVISFRGYTFHTMKGLTFTYTIKLGRNGSLTKEQQGNAENLSTDFLKEAPT